MITSSSNPLIKQARALRQRKARETSGLFLIEGIAHVGQAVEANWQLHTILYAPELLTSEYALKLIQDIQQRGIPNQPVSISVMQSLADKDHPQGIVALAHTRHTPISELTPERFNFCAALVSAQDPGNVGTILRTLDAVAADGLLLLDGGVDLYHPSAVRASMGALFWKPVIRTTFTEFVAHAQAYGYRLIGTSTRGSVDYRSMRRDSRPTVLVLGSEQKGLSPEQTQACETLVRLPMHGRVSSLNVAVAAGILLYALE
jgi:RNA methyltransferase, TrmH family